MFQSFAIDRRVGHCQCAREITQRVYVSAGASGSFAPSEESNVTQPSVVASSPSASGLSARTTT
jgi:hypothetical protein